MHSYKKLILTIVLMLTFHTASAWEKFQKYEVWIDKNTIQTTKNKNGDKKIYIWTIWNKKATVDSIGKSVKSLTEIDCKNRFAGSASFIVYSENDAKGDKLLETYSPSNYIEPDTLYNDMHKEFCKGWWKVW